MKIDYPVIYSHNNTDEYVSTFGDPKREIYYTKGYFLTEEELKDAIKIGFLSALDAMENHTELGCMGQLEMIRELRGLK